MTDLMERLRAADPIIDDLSPPPSRPLLARRQSPPKRRRRLPHAGRAYVPTAAPRTATVRPPAAPRGAVASRPWLVHPSRWSVLALAVIGGAAMFAGRRRRSPPGARRPGRDHPRGHAPRLRRRGRRGAPSNVAAPGRGRASARLFLPPHRALDGARPAARAEPLHARPPGRRQSRSSIDYMFADGITQIKQSGATSWRPEALPRRSTTAFAASTARAIPGPDPVAGSSQAARRR